MSQPVHPTTRPRVVVHQPALPSYRVPVFAELARRVDLRVVYGDVPNLRNVEPIGFDTEHRPGRRLGPGGRFMWFRRRDTVRHADAVVLSWNVNDLSLIPTLRKARAGGAGVVLWGHGFTKHDTPRRQKIRDTVGKLADAVLLYDTDTAADLVRRGFQAERVFVAANALDDAAIAAAADVWGSSAGRLGAWQAEHDLAGRKVVLFVSRLEAKAKLPLLYQAAAEVARDVPEAVFAIIGGGDLAAERAAAEAAGAAGVVRFVGPVYGEDKLAPYFLTADVFCYPAAIGLSAIHALAYGVPVVTDDDRENRNPEVVAIRDGENGRFFRANDAGDLARTLTALLTDDAMRLRMAKAASATVRETFNLKNMIDGFEAAVRYAAGVR